MKTLAIVTPSYKRAELLKNAYTSLQKQTSQDFVWYIIDDGSNDNTEEVAKELIKNSKFKIVFKSKQNGGKHTALNLAFDLIEEEITLILDNDDELLETAVETIVSRYKEIKDDEKICGLSFLRCYKDLKTIGVPFTEDGIVDNFTNQRINKNIYGDKCEVFKTKVLKQNKFAEFNNENFLSEASLWCKLSLNYNMKFFNTPIYMCEYLPGGLSDNVKKRLFKNPVGAVECYYYMSNKQTKLLPKIKYTIAYTVYSFAAKIGFKKQLKKVYSKFVYLLTYIPSFFIYLHKKHKYKD